MSSDLPDGKAAKEGESRLGSIWFWCVMKADRPRVWNVFFLEIVICARFHWFVVVRVRWT